MNARLKFEQGWRRVYELSEPITKGRTLSSGEDIDLVKWSNYALKSSAEPKRKAQLVEMFKDGCLHVMVPDGKVWKCGFSIYENKTKKLDSKKRYITGEAVTDLETVKDHFKLDSEKDVKDEHVLAYIAFVNGLKWEGILGDSDFRSSI